jgi:hypothetical protein
MEDDDRAQIVRDLRPQAWPYAVHEAGHAVVAHRLGEHLLSAEVDPYLRRDAGVHTLPIKDVIVDIAVTAAGCGAERLLGERASRKAKECDRKRLTKLLAQLPKAERRAARERGYRLAAEQLAVHENDVGKLASALMDRWSLEGPVRIERPELIKLLDGP